MGGFVLFGLILGVIALVLGLRWGAFTFLAPLGIVGVGMLMASGQPDEIGPTGFMSPLAGAIVATIPVALPVTIGVVVGTTVKCVTGSWRDCESASAGSGAYSRPAQSRCSL